MAACSIVIRDLVDLFLKKTPINAVASYVKKKHSIADNSLIEKPLLHQLRFVKAKFDKLYAKCNRKKAVLFQKNSEWLSSTFEITKGSNETAKRPVGRPKKSFSDVCKRTKTEKLKHLRESYTKDELISATVSMIGIAGNRDLAWVIEHLTVFPEKATEIKKLLKSDFSDKTNRLSVDEALRFLCENDFSKQQYQNIRNMTLTKGYNIYPSYNEVRENKNTCYPPGQ